MKTSLPWKVLPMKNKLMNIIAGQLIILLLLFSATESMVAQPVLLDPGTHPKFVQKLPVIKDLGLRIDLTAGNPTTPITVNMVETTQKLGLFDALGNQLKTRVWGYQFPGLPVTYPGATIVAMKDQVIKINWQNTLPTTGHLLPVDVNLHMAHPDPTTYGQYPVDQFYADGYIPTVTHLHGGHTVSDSDGLPEAWYTQVGMPSLYKGLFTGPNVEKYTYDNTQEAATLWYHDHALGITRLNVYAGLAGFYLLRDANENQLIADGTLPRGDYEIEMVIQDRDFDATGQLFLPAKDLDPFFGGTVALPTPVSPTPPFVGLNTIVAEYFGNFILVNGKAWPKHKVYQTKYRFRMLNGSDSRVYRLKIQDATGTIFVPMMQIGSDDGLLNNPVSLNELILAPGERADIVVDFTGLKGLFTMVNTGPDEPFKGLNFDGTNSDGAGGFLPVANPLTTGQIMQFQAFPGKNKKVPTFTVDVAASTDLRPQLSAIPDPAALSFSKTTQLVLFEGTDEYGRLQPMLGTFDEGSKTWSEDITENPALDGTELWEVYNATADAHPIHLHLVKFQILNREQFTSYDNLGLNIIGNVQPRPQIQHNSIPEELATYGTGGKFFLHPTTPFVAGSLTPPGDNELGYKDTFVVPPGHVGRLIATFDLPGRYVWHCHILSHEDHEMMRPFHVGPMPTANARMVATQEVTTESFPNPFQTSTQIRFELQKDQNIDFTVFDMQGKMIYHNLDYYREGKNAIFWDGFDKDGKILQTGVYLYRLQGDGFEESNRLVIER